MMLFRPQAWVGCAITVFALLNSPALAEGPKITVSLDALDADGRFQNSSAFCPPPGSPVKNVSPGVSWSKGPKETQSYALLMTDPDVPADLALINKPGVVIAANASRIRVFHWVLADIPPTLTTLEAGAEGQDVVPGGKAVGRTPHGLRGANVFTTFLAGVKGMGGTYGGYDGPCPPTNDRRVHHYIIHVLALDIATLGLSGSFTGADVERAATGHVIAEGQAVGTYSLQSETVK